MDPGFCVRQRRGEVRQRQNVLARRHRYYNIACSESISLNVLAEIQLDSWPGCPPRPRYEAPRPAAILVDISRARSSGYFSDCCLKSEDGLIETVRWSRGQEIECLFQHF